MFFKENINLDNFLCLLFCFSILQFLKFFSCKFVNLIIFLKEKVFY